MVKRILVIGTATYHMRRWFHYITPILPKDVAIDMYVTSRDATADMFDGAGYVYHTIETPKILKPLLKIPKVRALVMSSDQTRTLEEILSERHYYALNVHQIFPTTFRYEKVAKRKGMKIILTPWGSDVLRCPLYQVPMMKKVFQMADYVTYNLERFSEKYINMYDVDPRKMFFAGFGSEIFDLIPKYKGQYTKEEIAKQIDIPFAGYYIACGYNADQPQRHKLMIEAIGKSRDFLPNNTLLLFPFAYGNGKNDVYMAEMIDLCKQYDLKYHFVMNYLTNEQMALYRIIADLFIHIQPTDAANASLAEYLLAGVQVINGKWLDYPHLEKDGMPYHICESLESLPDLVRSFFEGKLQNRYMTDVVREKLMKGAWSNQRFNWVDLFCKI